MRACPLRHTSDVQSALAEKVHKNTKSMEIYRRMYTKPSEIPKSEPGSPLLTKVTGLSCDGRDAASAGIIAVQSSLRANASILRRAVLQSCGVLQSWADLQAVRLGAV